MNTLEIIEQIISSYPDKEVIFHRPVKVKVSPHREVFTCYGVHAENGVWLLDGGGEWHGPLKEDQVNAEYVINSLYQRLKMMEVEAA